MKHILLIDDHPVVRLATIVIIRDALPAVTSWEAENFSDAVRIVASQHLDLVLLDINLPDGEGFQMIEKIRRYQPDVLILIFSGVDEEIYAAHYLRIGADGFISKNSSTPEIRAAILAVFEDGRYISKQVQQLFLQTHKSQEKPRTNPLAALSQRELEVMDLLLEGKWTKEIATSLNISGSSVSTYKARIFEKLGVATVIELYQRVMTLRRAF
ncbi:response regulator transcription factor [Dyadobacter sp. CY261]|uniref:response regulator n=1 Tax=Dyadobacter sp. CY261 TaxID=2907203 RepID=UPI001F39C5EE|nr:response regulator transcription factor [Dyadobacter sp. CY261]MCF0070612.1 response regulator transcription factor [Dyadobacter sp. CY261]